MVKKELEEEFNKAYEEYVQAVYAAYESEDHFYAKSPRSPELEEKRMEAYRKFDDVRKRYLGKDK